MSIRLVKFGEGEFYHVFSRGVEKRKIFIDNGDYTRFAYLMYSANSHKEVHLSNYRGWALAEIPRGQPIVSIGAWCLMPNHFHILCKEVCPGGITHFMQKLLTGYSMFFNKKYDRSGTLFQGRFKASHLDNDNYLRYIYAYIHLNPIGIIDSGWKDKKLSNKKKAQEFLKNYKYSSYLDYSCRRSGQDKSLEMLLSRKDFPEYFETKTEFDDMIDGWLSFAEEGEIGGKQGGILT